MTLKNHIRRYRFEKEETSQDRLAQAVGVTRQTIYFIEKGQVVPSTMVALKIAKYFKKSVEDIFYLSNQSKTP